MTISNSGFTFCTWNIGQGEQDYQQLIKDRSKEKVDPITGEKVVDPTVVNLTDLDPKEILNPMTGAMESNPDMQHLESLANTRLKLLPVALDRLMTNNDVDVMALQELTHTDDEINTLKNKGYEIVKPDRKFPDTAIALNPKKFSSIENRSFVLDSTHVVGIKIDFAIAVAIENSSRKKIAFVSAQFSGFDLQEKDKKRLLEQAALGDTEVSDLVNKLRERCKDCDVKIVGADMNANPEIHKSRFDLFKKAGFDVFRTAKPTSHRERFGALDIEMKDRELDFVFVSEKPKGIIGFLKKLFGKADLKIDVIKDSSNLTLDPISSPSDHLPVLARVETVLKRTPFKGPVELP